MKRSLKRSDLNAFNWREWFDTKKKNQAYVAKPGLDGHDRGARIIARAYRDAGYEVVYSGLHQTPEEIVQAAIQEDVDVLGLSSLAGAHDLLPEIIAQLKKKGMDDVLVLAGGIIPDEDIPTLKAGGVSAVFQPGASIKDIAQYIRDKVAKSK